MTRPRPALLVTIIGALALGIGTVGVATAGSGMHVESVGVRPTSTPTPEAPASLSASAPDTTSSSGTSSPRSPYRTLARTDATQLPRPDRTPRPVRITIPAIDVATDIDVVGLAADGQVEVPYDVRRTGWYRFSSRAGSDAGSTVIVGHRDGIDQGSGAFAGLGELRPGDRITVERAGGSRLRYEVVAREAFAKSNVSWQEFFSRSGPARLTLITCGGSFDPSALSYTDNIVVTAVPTGEFATDTDSGQTR